MVSYAKDAILCRHLLQSHSPSSSYLPEYVQDEEVTCASHVYRYAKIRADEEKVEGVYAAVRQPYTNDRVDGPPDNDDEHDDAE